MEYEYVRATSALAIRSPDFLQIWTNIRHKRVTRSIQRTSSFTLPVFNSDAAEILQHIFRADIISASTTICSVFAELIQARFIPIRKVAPVVGLEPDLLTEQLLHHALLALLPRIDLRLLRGDDRIDGGQEVGDFALLREGRTLDFNF